MANTPHTSFRLDEETRAALEHLSKITGSSMTEVVKMAVNDMHTQAQNWLINVDPNYGDEVGPMTVEDYQHLNPAGRFEMAWDGRAIREYDADDNWHEVARIIE